MVLVTGVASTIAFTAAVLGLASASAATAADRPAETRSTPGVRLTAGFGARARLGRRTALDLDLRIDPRRVSATLSDVRVLTPAGLYISMSELGTAICRRPQSDLDRVRLDNLVPATCPANALLGSGSADALLRFSADQTIIGSGQLRLFNGAPIDGRPGLIALVVTDHPITTQLAYGGYLYTGPPPYGLAMRIRIPPMTDPPFGAAIGLVRLQLRIGGDDIVYTRNEPGHRIRYAPGGIPLPHRCPRGGFPFRAALRFDDGSRRTTDTVLPCPKPRRDPST